MAQWQGFGKGKVAKRRVNRGKIKKKKKSETWKSFNYWESKKLKIVSFIWGPILNTSYLALEFEVMYKANCEKQAVKF